MGVLHVTQRGEATAAAEIEGAAHPSSHSNGAADTRGSKLLLQDLDWTGVRPLYAEQRMRLERELPRDQPHGRSLTVRSLPSGSKFTAAAARVVRRSCTSRLLELCRALRAGVDRYSGAGDESEGTAAERRALRRGGVRRAFSITRRCGAHACGWAAARG